MNSGVSALSAEEFFDPTLIFSVCVSLCLSLSLINTVSIFRMSLMVMIQGFFAKPMLKPEGSTDLLRWECGLPGPVSHAKRKEGYIVMYIP